MMKDWQRTISRERTKTFRLNTLWRASSLLVAPALYAKSRVVPAILTERRITGTEIFMSAPASGKAAYICLP
jgi:hypothetical protein